MDSKLNEDENPADFEEGDMLLPPSNLANPAKLKRSMTRNFDPLKFPPDLELARIHGKANRVAIPLNLLVDNNTTKIKNDKMDVCDCCGMPVENKQYPLCCKKDDLFFLGSGFPLFFEYVIYGIVLLGIILLVSGLFNFIANLKSDGCIKEKLILEKPCKADWLSSMSIFSRDDNNHSLMHAQNILDLISIIIVLLFLQLLRRSHRRTAFSCDFRLQSASDYTLLLSNLPESAQDEDVINFLKNLEQNEPIKVEKINRCFFLGETQVLLEKKAQLVNDSISLERKIEQYRSSLPEMKKGNASNSQRLEARIALLEAQNEKKKAEIKAISGADKVQDLSKGQEYKFAGCAFVTLEKPVQASEIKKALKLSKWQYLRLNIGLEKNLSSKYMLKGKIIFVSRAPEPDDVLWENLGYSWFQRTKYRVITTTVTVLILGISFSLLLLISTLQIQYSEDEKSAPLKILIKTSGAFLILITNSILNYLIRKMTYYEKHETNTAFEKGIAEKRSFAQFFNTTLMMFLTAYYFKIMTGPNSLLSNIFFFYLTNAFVTPTLLVFDPWHLYELYRKRTIEKDPDAKFLTQKEVNEIFDGRIIDIPFFYSLCVNIMLLGAFYASIFPLALLFSCLTLGIYYWCVKYILLRQAKLPPSLGKQMAYSMIEFSEYVPLAFVTGDFIFTSVLFGGVSLLNIISMAFCVCNFTFPMWFINRVIFSLDEKHKLRKEDPNNSREFQKARTQFSSEYDRLNPVTKASATKEWVNFIESRPISELTKLDAMNFSQKGKVFSALEKIKPKDQSQATGSDITQSLAAVDENRNTREDKV